MHVVVVSCMPCAAAAAATVDRARRLGHLVHVLDLDASLPEHLDSERLSLPGLDRRDLHLRVARDSLLDVAHELEPLAVATVAGALPPDEVLLLLRPGVLLLADPNALTAAAARRGLATVRPAPIRDDGHWPAAPATGTDPMAAVRARSVDLLTAHRVATAGGSAGPGAELTGPTHLLGPLTLVPEHRVTDDGDGLAVDGVPVVAVDLSAMDPTRPWLLDARADREPRARLSDHPVLAAWVTRAVAGWPAVAGGEDLTRTSLGTPVDDALRAVYRAAGADAPDPFGDPGPLRDWLGAEPRGDGLSRWLLGVYAARDDLRSAFPRVPGPDSGSFLRWADTFGRREGYPEELLPAPGTRPAGATAPPPGHRLAGALRVLGARFGGRPAPGVAVVGFLNGELGIGESARQVVAALRAAGVPCSTVAVEPTTGTRAAAPFVASDDAVRTTTVLCVNADLTPVVAERVRRYVTRSYTIGMWYWEVEDFPPSQHGGFAPLDEVWVATDFVRRAVEPHSPVPVRTLTPPLPQRGPAPSLGRPELGLPEDRPVLLFSFDFLSTAERKNPWGLVEAFSRAFTPDEGPVLVVKSINAGRRPADAERLRLAAAGRPDVILNESYLDASARDALVAHCDAYVSLHRSEGLGLTMAEAMAWGKPVVATGYSGNLHFMTEDNSFLVPFTPVPIPAGCEPYPVGGRWADPDLDEAARLIRLVVEDPAGAAVRGARAASDIAAAHSPGAAGAAFAARLAEIGG